MRIKIINPDYGMSETEIEERIQILNKVVGNDVELTMECLKASEINIDSALDVSLAAGEIILNAVKSEQTGYDGIILYCMSDPAIVACRELLTIPVLGGGQTAVLTAAALGYNFSMIVTEQRRIPEKKEFIRTTGIDPGRLCSIRSISVSLDDIRSDIKKTTEAIVREGRCCIQEDGAQVLVLGCLSFLGMADTISNQLGIPVIDPAVAAVSKMECLIRQGLSHSKKAYPEPPAGTRTWMPGKIIL